MKVALVYDRLNKTGGAEEILKSLSSIYPKATWYTSVYNPKKTPFTKNWHVKTSPLNTFPFLRSNHELVPFIMPFAFEYFDFSDYDLVISVSSAEAKGIITGVSTLHINYCLTPTRYLWSHRKEYLSSSQYKMLKILLNPLSKYLNRTLQKWDLVASTRPDYMISISDHVKNRVKKYYNRESDVIHPPVSVDRFAVKSKYTPKEKDYFLVVSRLVPYKKLDKLIKAFNKTERKLVIIGEGTDKNRLIRLANKNIIFKGYVEDNELVGYYQHCIAFIQSNEEDFGIAMVEAQAAGKPVIAYKLGGASEIVLHGKTGLLIEKFDQNSLLQAIEKIEKMDILQQACIDNARQFSKYKFEELFTKKIKALEKLNINKATRKQTA